MVALIEMFFCAEIFDGTNGSSLSDHFILFCSKSKSKARDEAPAIRATLPKRVKPPSLISKQPPGTQ